MKTEIEIIGPSLIGITSEIPTEILETYRKKAVARLASEVKIDGFRDGKVPESVLKQKVGDAVILEEMAEMAIQEAYPKIIEEHKLDTIGRPKVKITKLAPGNPLGFTIETAVMPEVKLPDYKKIIHETREEFDKKELIVGEKETKEEKQLQHNIDKTNAFVDRLAEKSKLDLPELLVEYELSRMWRQFTGRIEEAGLQLKDYLEQTKKTEEEKKKEWRGEAEKRAKSELVLREIAKTEKIEIKQEEIEGDVKKIMEMYREADLHATQNYVAENLQNKKLFELFASF